MRIVIYDRDRFYVVPGGAGLIIDTPGTWFLADHDTVAVESGQVLPEGPPDVIVTHGGRACWPYYICNEGGEVIANVYLIAAWAADPAERPGWRVLIEFNEAFTRGLRLEVVLPEYTWPLEAVPEVVQPMSPSPRFEREEPL